MRKRLFTPEELIALGFIEQTRGELDAGDYYRFWTLRKNNSELSFTYEYNAANKWQCGIVDLNCETLLGRAITKQDVQILIELM